MLTKMPDFWAAQGKYKISLGIVCHARKEETAKFSSTKLLLNYQYGTVLGVLLIKKRCVTKFSPKGYDQ